MPRSPPSTRTSTRSTPCSPTRGPRRVTGSSSSETSSPARSRPRPSTAHRVAGPRLQAPGAATPTGWPLDGSRRVVRLGARASCGPRAPSDPARRGAHVRDRRPDLGAVRCCHAFRPTTTRGWDPGYAGGMDRFAAERRASRRPRLVTGGRTHVQFDRRVGRGATSTSAPSAAPLPQGRPGAHWLARPRRRARAHRVRRRGSGRPSPPQAQPQRRRGRRDVLRSADAREDATPAGRSQCSAHEPDVRRRDRLRPRHEALPGARRGRGRGPLADDPRRARSASSSARRAPARRPR